MSEPAHSPAPFRRLPPTADHGHIILDALGDSIGALAYQTGDHPPEEQLANAVLFTAAPALLAALKGLIAVRPVNWDDGEDQEQLDAWTAAHTAVRLAEDLS